MYDLIVTKQKNNKKKLLIILTTICLFLGVFFIIGINKLNIANNKDIQVAKITEIDINDVIIKQKNIEMRSRNKLALTQEQIDKINNIYSTSEEKRVFLTFDDGPSKTVTPQILDILKQENVPATFFVLGYRVELSPELVKREFDEGHYIANHGYSHKYASIYETPESTWNEYVQCEQSIKNALQNQDYNSYLFRFPGGSSGGKYENVKKSARDIFEQNKIAYTNWNALTGDAAGAVTKEAQLQSMFESIEGDDSIILLMHDAGDKQVTVETLPEIIKYFRNQGYVFKNFYEVF